VAGVGNPTVWLDLTLARDATSRSAVPRALNTAGIAVVPRQRGAEHDDFGVVLMEEVSPDSLSHVRSVSAGGRTRVLVLVTSAPALRPGDSWRLLAHGASDVLTWDDLAGAQLADRLARWSAVEEVLDSPTVREELVGVSRAWRAALGRLVEVARFTGSALLITGESGTGKELAARLVHHLDTREDRGRLVVVDCTTVVPTLSGSEFFGHEKGAFTGAHSARDGAFAAANAGTLFLDEVGELPIQLQAELLRVIQEGTYKRVGSNDWRHTVFRLVCATNRHLLREVTEGRFRADLYYRIAAATVTLPPLRERRTDILPLFQHFVRHARGGALDLDRDVRTMLEERDYPGNVRDLKQLALRILSRHVGTGPITVGTVPEDERPEAAGGRVEWQDVELDGVLHRALDCGLKYEELRAAVTSSAHRIAMERAGGSQRRAAEMLGLSTRALQKQRQRSAADGRWDAG
jgi:transcriptional regulator with GAF, ATPase, and Fis domain